MRHDQGRFVGYLEALEFSLRQEAILVTLVEEIVSASELDGAAVARPEVRRAVARRLGLGVTMPPADDSFIEGAVDVLVDATRRYDEPLSVDRIRGWHRSLFPGGGRVRPEAEGDLGMFIRGFEEESAAGPPLDPVLKAGLAHVWFLAIDPFAAGNSRIALAIAALSLARSDRSPRRFYSLSAQIRQELPAYREVLGRTAQGSLDVTPWLEWFFGCLGRALGRARAAHAGVLARARFWRAHPDLSINDRQRLMLDRLLGSVDRAAVGLTTSTWAQLASCSHDTALRDILPLVARGILVRGAAGGRSTSYRLR